MYQRWYGVGFGVGTHGHEFYNEDNNRGEGTGCQFLLQLHLIPRLIFTVTNTALPILAPTLILGLIVKLIPRDSWVFDRALFSSQFPFPQDRRFLRRFGMGDGFGVGTPGHQDVSEDREPPGVRDVQPEVAADLRG